MTRRHSPIIQRKLADAEPRSRPPHLSLQQDARMKDRYRQQWEALGSYDPYWAVISDPAKRRGKWNKEEFFQSGIIEIGDVLARLNALGLTPNFDVALDFGCGVGRLSSALAKHFKRVLGVDISQSMLTEARSANAHIGNIEFIHNIEQNLRVVDSGSVDFLYSNLVLQHMPRERQEIFIREFCRVLRPGATLLFQTPSRPNLRTMRGWAHRLAGNRVLNIARRLRQGRDGVMELHTLEQSRVLQILAEQRMKLVQVEPNSCAGLAFHSYSYCATKNL
ncbi:hypothetical protein BH11PSE11_BH11PSE11_18310 [soil metagenome]